MIISNIRITDIHSLIRVIECVHEAFSAPIWWRGNLNKDYKLQPSVFRPRESGNSPRYEDDFEYEGNIRTLFVQKAFALRSNLPSLDAWSEWLFLMQHYGLPTRLLDWTESPLIACYFAVQKKDGLETDGALFALDPFRLNYHFSKQVGIINLQNSSYKEAINQYSVLAICPNMADLRMIAQLSAFTLHNEKTPLEEYEQSSHFLVKFEIPYSVKQIIRRQLINIGIRRSSIFPDLEHLAEEIKPAYEVKKDMEIDEMEIEMQINNCKNNIT